MVVTKDKHREICETAWNIPAGTIPPKPGFHAVQQHRKLKDGDLNCHWVQCNNNLQAAPNINEEGFPGYRNPDNFITVSGALPHGNRHDRRPDPAYGHGGSRRKAPMVTLTDELSFGISRLTHLVNLDPICGKSWNFQRAL